MLGNDFSKHDLALVIEQQLSSLSTIGRAANKAIVFVLVRLSRQDAKREVITVLNLMVVHSTESPASSLASQLYLTLEDLLVLILLI